MGQKTSSHISALKHERACLKAFVPRIRALAVFARAGTSVTAVDSEATEAKKLPKRVE